MLKGVSLLPGVYCKFIADYIPGLQVPLKNNIHLIIKLCGQEIVWAKIILEGTWDKGSDVRALKHQEKGVSKNLAMQQKSPVPNQYNDQNPF